MTRDLKIPPNSKLSYFMNITISQPRIRIKVPKLLAKTMQKRSHHHSHNINADANNTTKKKWAKSKRLLLPKKVGFIFSNVFCNKKSPETCSSNGENDRVHSNKGDGFNGVKQEKEREILKDVEYSHSLKDIFELEDDGVKQKRVERREKLHRSIMGKKSTPLKVALSLSSFFNKKSSRSTAALNLMKSKINKSISKGDSSGNGVETHYNSSVNGTLGSSGDLGYKVASTRVKMRWTKSIQKKATKQFEEESEEEEEEKEETGGGDEELCKKRILMGERCRPLNID